MAETPPKEDPNSTDARMARIEAALTAPQTGTGKFIGLADGAPLSNVTDETVQPGQKAPRYYKGAEWIPIMSGKTPMEIAAMQDEMVRVGLLDTDYLRGSWDPASRAAFSELLGQANASGTDYNEALVAYENSAPMEIGPDGIARRKNRGAQRAGKVLQLTNPNDLIATANEVAQKRIGRTFSQDELNRFVQSYQASERGAQSAQYDASATGSAGGTITAPMSDKTAANKFAEQVDPVAAEARNMLPMVESIKNLLNGDDFGTVQPGQGSARQ